MMRKTLLWLSGQQQVFRFVRSNPLARRFASRFVAGESVESAVDAVRPLNARGISASLDLLGESVTRAEEAARARDEYLRMLDRIHQMEVDANVSVKLTQMGLDISNQLCLENMTLILDRARQYGTFVRLDMEGSAYTERTLDFFANRLYDRYAGVTGVVIQSCLRRSAADVDRLIEMGARVRLCKGAYLEPPEVAFSDKAEVDRNYLTLMERLLENGNYPGLATHDEKMLDHARAFARGKGLSSDRFEFQMLYGVRRDLQLRLRHEGYRMRVYIPFGTQWYPYLMRRLPEPPANIAFILGGVFREALSRR